MSSSRAMQRLCGLMRKAVQQYEMFGPRRQSYGGRFRRQGQRSSDHRSRRLRKYIGFQFTWWPSPWTPSLAAGPWLHRTGSEPFAQYDISYEIRRTLIGPVVFDYRNEKNPCSLCA